MSSPSPHSLTLFSLVPSNDRADDTVDDERNRHLVSQSLGGQVGIDVGFHIHSRSQGTLTTIGRGDADIVVRCPSVSRIQCSFEIDDPDAGVVMLYDRSHSQSTQTFGPDAVPFEHGRPRRILVAPGVNTTLGMGGARCDLVQFELVWREQEHTTIAKLIKAQMQGLCRVRANPCHARTENGTPARRLSLPLRYVRLDQIGSGQFGQVHKAIDVDAGRVVAVKVIKPTQLTRDSNAYQKAKREVEVLARLDHPHIINYIAAQPSTDQGLEIFMGLQEGNVETLVQRGLFDNGDRSLSTTLFHHMLQALDVLAFNGILHRDVKPENILYTSSPTGDYVFRLADFGLCNLDSGAVTMAGSPRFMAPEILCMAGDKQTSKADCWSLFVTMAWVLNVNGYRHRQMRTARDYVGAALAAAESSTLQGVKEMAVVDPEKRASAAQMLIKHFGGDGLTTPVTQVLRGLF